MSDLNLVAARYVDALFALSTEQKQHDAVKQDMQNLEAAFAESEMLRTFVTNPIVTREQTEQAMNSVLETIHASDLTKKFFALLSRERRLEIAPVAARKFLDMLAESRNELTVQVTSAKPLTKDQIAQMTDALSKSTGKKVTMNTAENPNLIGGVQVRIGSKLLDHTVAGKLTRMRLALTRAA